MNTIIMKRLHVIVVLLLVATFSFKARSQNKDFVLVINSYTESHTWSRPFIDAIYEECINGSLSLRVFTENMTLLKVNDENALDEYAQELCRKYENTTPAAIVYLGNASWRMLDGRLPAHWSEVPAVLCGENDYVGPLEAYLKKAVIGDDRTSVEQFNAGRKLKFVYAPYYPQESVDLIHKIMPTLKQLILLYDRRNSILQVQKDLLKYIDRKYPELDVLCLNPDTTSNDSLTSYISRKRPDTAILYLSWTNADPNFGTPMAARVKTLLGARTSMPVFLLDDETYDVDGLIGGCYRSVQWQKEMILKGLYAALSNQGNNYTLFEDRSVPAPILVYPDLLYYGLSPDNCPEDTIFLHKPESFFSKYRYGILGVMGVGLILFVWMLWLNKSRRMQQKQIELMSEYNNLVDNMPILYFKGKLIFNKDHQVEDFTIVRFNSHFARVFRQGENLFGMKGSEMNRNMHFKSDIRLIEQAYTHRKTLTLQRFFDLVDMHLNIIVVPSSSDGYVDIFGVDMTELAEAQQALRSVNHKLSMALEIANMNPWKWDLKTHTITCDVNRPFKEATAETDCLDEPHLSIPDKYYFSNIHPDDKGRLERAYKDLLAGITDRLHEEYRVVTRHPDGPVEEWVEAKAVVDQYDEKGKPAVVIGSALKTTERKRMETDLLVAKEKADESNRLKSAFLANMSHEIRTPLNAIVGFSQVLASARSEQEKAEYVSIIENNNALLLQLIGDILDLSKIEAGTLELNYSEVNVDALFRDMEASMRMLLRGSDVALNYVCEVPGLYARTDKNRLSQVMINFLNNAVKFTKEGCITFGCRLKDEKTLYCYVIDTGCGIAEDKIDMIFERFTKLDSFAHGTGLGLTICRSIVESMGGKIGVVSKEGIGSTFWIELPYEAAQPVEQQLKIEPQVLSIHKDDKMTILVAEDNDSNFKLIKSILEDQYNIIHAWNGQEAIDLFKLHHPHLILMDISMPGMDGYEATRRIREISTTVPIMAVTAFAYAEDEKRIMKSGFDAYTSKPVSAKQLSLQINEVLKKRFLFL